MKPLANDPTAMFAYAMLLGIQNDLLNREPYQEAVDKAWPALTTLIDPDGNVQEICVSTGKPGAGSAMYPSESITVRAST